MRRRRRLLLVVGFVAALWAAACAVLLVRAAGDLRAGRAAAQSVREGLDAAAIAEGEVLAPLREAADRFGSARRAARNPVLAPLRVLPVVGRQLRSVVTLSGVAREVSDAGADAVARARTVLAEPAGRGPARVDQVRIISETLSATQRRLAAIDDLGPRVGLVRPLAEARNELAGELDDALGALSDASAGADAALSLLDGPRRYLLVAANNAEMRAGSGMWLSGGVLTTAGGRMDLGEVAPLHEVADPPNGSVPITDRHLAARWGFWNPTDDWRGLMTSPRFPVAAEHGLRMWEAARGERLDGLVVVDPVALAAVVRATRPVQVGEIELGAEEVEHELLHGQYVRFDDLDESEARRELLGEVASDAFRALDEGEWSAATLIEELAGAVRGRHLLVWSRDEQEQAGWEAGDMTGTLRPTSLMVSVLNRGGNKLDVFLDVDAELTMTAEGSATAAELRIDLTNTAPEGLPPYVSGPPAGGTWAPGTYVGQVAVTVPGDAEAVSAEGRGTTVVTEGRDGPARVISTAVEIPRGASQEVVVRFRLPSGQRVLHVEPSARRPATSWRAGRQTWEDSRTRTLNWDRHGL